MAFAQQYTSEIVTKLMDELSINNIMAVPKIEKIVVNAGVGTYLAGDKNTAQVEDGIARITGQKPVVVQATKSVSNFKLREGMPNGVRVTLRGKRMYDFLERFIKVVAPRIRDFRGFSTKSFDGRGNYSLGLKEHLIFPEIPTDEVIKPFGLQITVQTSAKTNEEAKALLNAFGFPFAKKR